jgi:hypothetical protein
MLRLKKSIALLVLVIVQLAHAQTDKTVLSTQDKQRLNDIVLNHEFYSGCVTEKIADLASELCSSQNQCTDRIDENPASNAVFVEQLDYQAWLVIYKACIANKL